MSVELAMSESTCYCASTLDAIDSKKMVARGLIGLNAIVQIMGKFCVIRNPWGFLVSICCKNTTFVVRPRDRFAVFSRTH